MSKHRILIVDDYRPSCDALARLLALHGYEVDRAYDANQALERAEAHLPRLVLLDLGLPDRHGADLARELRERVDGQGELALVAVTGLDEEPSRREARRGDFDGFFTKPVDFPRLLARVEELLGD